MNIALVPQPLKTGDTLGVIAPAGRLSDIKRFESGVAVLRDMGFKLAFPRDLWPGKDYLADSDANRASEFNCSLANSEIKAFISLRGGYGCLRMVDKIDHTSIAAQAKMITGFSDITILLNYLYQKSGLMSLHGPVLTSLGNTSSLALERFFLCLTGRWDEPLILKKIEVLRDGPVSTAPLVGGNLASLTSILGTSYDFSWDDKIVFLEDVNEPVYKVDRMLTQLFLAGKFERLAGLILGNFSGHNLAGGAEQIGYLESIWSRVLELCSRGNFPIWGNFPCGHCPDNLTLPVGALAAMQSGKSRLVFPTARTRQ